MRVRIKFSKFDTMRFIGHLDVMRYFQKLFNRAGLPVKYSEGYHPHQILSFAQPLGLGITSDGEYLDVELTKEMDCDAIVKTINNVISHGFYISEAVRLSDREPNKKLVTSMSLINRSVYLISLKDICGGCDGSKNTCEVWKTRIDGLDFIKCLNDFLSQKEILVLKKSKKGEKEISLKDFIFEVCDYSDNIVKPIYLKEGSNSIINQEMADRQSVHAPEFFNNKKFIVSLSAGSETNINPELFLESFLKYCSDYELSTGNFRIHRMELLGGEPGRSVSLCRIP